jgi:wyosine [tRNA(Phe)-imidazoG37] synthetase (radical SAM superfamily)
MVDIERRSYDASIAEIKQQLLDLKEIIMLRETACQSMLMSRINTHELEISELRKFMRNMETPVRFVGWAMVILVGGILAVFGSRSGKAIWEKFFG